jgi:threonine/homoserine/homoserine lactone efflux protein
MPELQHFTVFLGAALLLAITPGPGLLYVLGRSISGGRREGSLSSLGTFFGGLVHVLAAGLGLSAILATSATAFALVKYAGAAYLIYMGISMIRSRHIYTPSTALTPQASSGSGRRSFLQGIWTEVLNPKTALLFLAFIPQFGSPSHGHLFLQFIFLGSISVAFNTCADLTVASLAGLISDRIQRNPQWQSRQRVASGAGMIGLGLYVAVSGTEHR